MAKIETVQQIVSKVVLELHPNEAQALAAALKLVRGTAARAAGPIGQVKSRLNEGGFTGLGFETENDGKEIAVNII